MSMADRDGLIWFDGEMIPWREANVHVLTHSLHYGMGVFEGVRAYKTPDGTAIFRLDAHTDRLFDSAHIMGMKIPFTKEQLNEAQRAVVRENKLETAYIRPLVFYGSEGMGIRADNLKVHVVIAAWHWGAYMGEGALENGVDVGVCFNTGRPFGQGVAFDLWPVYEPQRGNGGIDISCHSLAAVWVDHQDSIAHRAGYSAGGSAPVCEQIRP